MILFSTFVLYVVIQAVTGAINGLYGKMNIFSRQFLTDSFYNSVNRSSYYVRVRTYKTVKVNGENTKVYSGWSTVKTVKTKK